MGQLLREQDHMYYKTPQMIQLDNEIGDLYGQVVDAELVVQRELEERLLHIEPLAITIMDLIAELDCLIAFTLAARQLNYVRPVLVDENIVEIVEGRHPLGEVCIEMFVPNDTDLGVSGKSTIQIITGAQSPDRLVTGWISASTGYRASFCKLLCRLLSAAVAPLQLARSHSSCAGPNFCGKSVYLKQVGRPRL
jgi:DNA mismatch repair protein MSH5